MTDLSVADDPKPYPQTKRRTRFRRDSLKLDKAAIVNRVIDFYERDLSLRSGAEEKRLQRYAKFRQWTEGKDWPWEGASDVAIPDLMEKSLRVQDTLFNAVLAQSPPISAKAKGRSWRSKEKTVDTLIHHQLFVDLDGETILSDAIEAFVNDGVMTLYVPWVEETREVVETRVFDPIPPERDPTVAFETLLKVHFPDAAHEAQGDGWDWSVVPNDPEGERFQVKFYTRRRDGAVEMVVRREVEVFNGPRPIPLDWEDVITPSRVGNLQPPGPSNPQGSPHVIVRSYPVVDEIKRLAKGGFYDLLTAEDIKEKLETAGEAREDRRMEGAKDTFGGSQEDLPKVGSHRRLTRLMCFDTYDIDGDGLDEDVVFWVLKEPKLLLKAKLLSEMYPANPPRRPFAEAQFMPVPGRRDGISLLEQVEGLHDFIKQLFDQMADAGTMSIAPIGFYRASGGLKPETIRMWPGDLYPLADPQRDVNFPAIGNPQAQAVGLNVLSLLQTWEDRLVMIGDLQLGRVPAGRSSALRTSGNMEMLAGQGEARPERILRRFFNGLAELWAQIHELNQAFLPRNKQVLMAGYVAPGSDPYLDIADREAIKGRFHFTFGANILNTQKLMLQQSLQAAMALAVNPVALQLGITRPDGIHRLYRDIWKALGLDPDDHLAPPLLSTGEPPITAEDAITALMQDMTPLGLPAEGAVPHLQKLKQFENSPDFGFLSETGVQLYQGWLQLVEQYLMLEMQQQQMLAGAGASGSMGGEEEGGRPPGEGNPDEVSEGDPPVSGPNEMRDETLPSAGGGGSQGLGFG